MQIMNRTEMLEEVKRVVAEHRLKGIWYDYREGVYDSEWSSLYIREYPPKLYPFFKNRPWLNFDVDRNVLADLNTKVIESAGRHLHKNILDIPYSYVLVACGLEWQLSVFSAVLGEGESPLYYMIPLSISGYPHQYITYVRRPGCRESVYTAEELTSMLDARNYVLEK